MKIAEVVSGTHKKDFLKVPKLLYKNDKFWVCPLDSEIKAYLILRKTTNLKRERLHAGYCIVQMAI